MSAGKVIVLVVGSLVLLVGVALLIGGGAIVGVDRGFTDASGFLTAPSAELARDTYAITGRILVEDDWIWWYQTPARARVTMTGAGSTFLGIGTRADVEAYLADISYAEIEDLDFDDYRHDRVWATTYRDVVGTSDPTAPGDQTFWVASASGEGTQTLDWTIEAGDWVFVAMNAEATRGIELEGTVGVEAPWLLGLGIAVLAVGLFLVAVGLVLILVIARHSRTGAPVEAEATKPTMPRGYPVTVTGTKTEPLSPALWLVKWLLIIPHLIVLPFLWVGFAVSWLLALFAILFTGRYPRGLFDYNVGVLRWTWRVAFYSYDALGTDQYPPFTLQAGGYPADFEVQYPERLSPGLVLVKWWLLAIPHYILVGIFQGGAGFYECGLIVILTIFAGISLLFTGKYPDELFRLILGLNRWTLRVAAYAALMTDEYPPFRLEE